MAPVTGPAGAAPPKPECRTEVVVEADARVLAQACGVRVEVTSRRSERSLTYVNPDGSFTSVISPVPQRVRQGAGWADVDPTLIRRGDGAIAARAVLEPLALSRGGTGPLLTFGKPGRRYSLTWPLGVLPQPVLNGPTAIYPEVLPGVDLRIDAGVDSYRQLLVIKTRQAASNPALRRVALSLTTDGVALRAGAGGRVEVVDTAGALVFESSGAYMWDSPQPVVPANEIARGATTAAKAAQVEAERTAQHGEPTPHRRERMPVEVSKTELAVLPLQQMLTAADTIFPVMIDPAFSKPAPMWYTNVMDDSPNTSFYGDYSELRVGRAWTTSNVWRAHMQFDTAELKGSTILTADLSMTADHTASCSGTSIQLWQTQYVSSPGSYTWYNDSDGDWMSRLDTKTFSANESSCPEGDDENVFGGYLKGKLQAGATGNSSRFTVGLRASNESDHYQWTRFLGNKSFLTVTYNRKPNLPTNMAISDCYLNCTSSPVVSRKDPELSVFGTDPDPNTILTVYFEVQTSGGAVVASGAKTGYASGPTKPSQPAKWRITPLLGDGSYRWRARTRDEQNSYSDYTGWFYFSTDSTAPAVPKVTPSNSSLYFPDDNSGSCSGGIGVNGAFNLSADTSVLQFTWSLDGGAFSSPVAAGGTSPKTATINVKPFKDLARTLRVRAYDGAGRYGEASYEFRVCSPEPEAGHWKLDGSSMDDEDLIAVPHHASGHKVVYTQSRLAPEPDQPEYTMTSGLRTFIPAEGAVLPLEDYEGVEQVALPFAFPFYGGSYSQAWVDIKGIVAFAELPYSMSYGWTIPSSPWQNEANLAVYPFWDDLIVEPDSSIRTAVHGTAPNRAFIVEWRNVGFWASSTARVTFQVQLHENGTVVFAYRDIAAGDPREDGRNATIGIENAAGSRAVVYHADQQPLSTGYGVTFTPTGYVAPYYPEGYYEARFDGTASINTWSSLPVLATGPHPETGERRSFGVAAWVRVTDTTAYRTAVSQQGANKSIFELGYQAGSTNNYCFTMFESDSTAAAGTRVCATAPVVAGEWVHLAGVYDGPSGTMTLYVHHKDEFGFVDTGRTEIRTGSFTAVWDATGAFTIGRAIAGAHFVGDIDEVWAWQRTPEQTEIELLALN
ncbi:LamG domain-containing protein [Micromonospora sp. NPDC047620]|uniref:LamG domain-containing protein n=1 Tax=Micromonospora sp. NPDC047620 TaxID=3364251 RepID=UPI00371D2C44